MLTRLVFDPNADNVPQPFSPSLLPSGFTGNMWRRNGRIRLERHARRPVRQKDGTMKDANVTDVLNGVFDGQHLILDGIGGVGAGEDVFNAWVDFCHRTGMSANCYFNVGNQSSDIQGLLRRLEAAGRIARAAAGLPNARFAVRVLR